jgi:chromate transporter
LGKKAALPENDSRLRELALVFLRLGATSFGGPAVHIALMEDEFVRRRGWLNRQRYLDLVGATSVIPGPNSTEVALHIGFLRAGLPGLLVAGVCFIGPAVVLTVLLAAAYARYGALPNAKPFLTGMAPVVLAVLLGTVWRLGRPAVKNIPLGVVALLVFGVAVAGANETAALFGGGILGGLWLSVSGRRKGKEGGAAATATLMALWATAKTAQAQAVVAAGTAGASVLTAAAPGLVPLGLFFLKIGAILYGSGYVLIAFLEGGLVHERGWLTQTQLLDAVAAGQFTPGPLFSTATFVGYQIAGLPGALVATVGIFVPAFVFVALLAPRMERLRRIPLLSAFLDAVNVSSLALMAAVAVRLATHTLIDVRAATIAVVALALYARWNVNAAWLVLGGALVGAAAARLMGSA